MQKLEERPNGRYITNRRKFAPLASFKPSTIEMVFEFAYSMSFGKIGEHRNHRSGGLQQRNAGGIFADTFQGKLSEFAFYNTAYREIPIEKPGLEVWELGKWDEADFFANGYSLNIKSTKAFGNLLLLETKDWNEQAQYLPNIEKGHFDYDYFILVRMKPYCEELLGSRCLLSAGETDKELLRHTLLSEKWEYDIPGWCSRAELVQIIGDKHIIKQGEMLNGKTRIDAANFYVQTGCMHNIKELFPLLKTKK